jgi:hypothetical protein
MYSLLEKLVEIRNGVLCGTIDLSSGLLHTQRVLTGLIPDGDVHWINREVLGYLEDERQDICAQLDDLDPENIDHDSAACLPIHRTLPGLWLSWTPSETKSPTAVPGAILCLRGVIEFEHLIVEESSSHPTYVPLEYNDERGFAFLCDVKDIQEMHQRIKDRLCTFLGAVIEGVHDHSESEMLPPRL